MVLNFKSLIVSHNNKSALMNAITNNDINTVTTLLQQKVDSNITYKYGLTPLMIAARFGFNDIVKTLLNHQAGIHAKDNLGLTALMFAANYGQNKVVKTLLDAGADANAKTNENETALMLALQHQHFDTAEILRSYGAK